MVLFYYYDPSTHIVFLLAWSDRFCLSHLVQPVIRQRPLLSTKFVFILGVALPQFAFQLAAIGTHVGYYDHIYPPRAGGGVVQFRFDLRNERYSMV